MKNYFTKGAPSPLSARSVAVFVLVLSVLGACNSSGNADAGAQAPAIDTAGVPVTRQDSLKEALGDTLPPTNKKRVYLTFDDGPNLGTRNLLTILHDEKVPATMFLIGLHTGASPEQKLMWGKLQTFPGIELCNHSYSHAWRNKFTPFYQHADSIIADFNHAQTLMALQAPIARTPGRNAWRIDSLTRTDLLKNKRAIDTLQSKGGYVLIGWDLEWTFNHRNNQAVQTADQLYAQVNSLFVTNKTLIPNNLVILAHDQMWRTPEDSLRLVAFIRKLKRNPDYELALIRNYPGVRQALLSGKRL